VLLLKAEHDARCRRIVVAVAADRQNEVHERLDRAILEMAMRMSQLDGAQVDIVHVWSVYGGSLLKEHMRQDEYEELAARTREHAEQQLVDLLKPYPLRVDSPHVHLLRGEAGEALPAFVESHNTDLLVMGTVGRAGLSGLLIGNTAELILDRVDCSILALKPDSFQSPVKV
jgi:nucleotide-binding universal stress UspA family protein